MRSALAVSPDLRASASARIWLAPLLVGLGVYVVCGVFARQVLNERYADAHRRHAPETLHWRLGLKDGETGAAAGDPDAVTICAVAEFDVAPDAARVGRPGGEKERGNPSAFGYKRA